VNGQLTVVAGTTLDMGTNTLSGSSMTTAGDGIIRTNNTSATPLPSGVTWNVEVDYYATTGGQTIVQGSYTVLTQSNTSGTNVASGSVNIDSELSLNGATLNMGTHQLTGSGFITTGTGTIITQNTSATPLPVGETWSMNIHYNATTTQTIVAGTYAGNLITSGSALKNMGGNITVSGTLDMSSKVAVGNHTLTLNGDLSGSTTNSLSFNANSNLTIGGSSPSTLTLYVDQTTAGTTDALANLTYNRSGATITLNDSLRIINAITPSAGQLNTNNRLILVSNSSGTARILQGSGTYIIGNVRAQRFIPQLAGRRWRFLSSPVASTTLEDWRREMFVTGPGTGTTVGTLNSNGFDATHNNTQSVFSYDESVSGHRNNGWVGATHISNPISTGRGYRVFIRGDRSDTAFITRNPTLPPNDVTLDVVGAVHTGNITMPVSFTSTSTIENDGWNLLGNPYPCPIDWNAFYDAGTDFTNLGPNIWVYDPVSNNYLVYNALSNAGDLPNGLIASGQSFWVKATGASPSMTMREMYKTAANPTEAFKTMPNSSFTVRVILDTLNSDRLTIKYINGATKNNDIYDALELPGTVSLSAYGSDNLLLALTSRPLSPTQNDTIFLALSGSQGNYRMMFDNTGAIPVHDALYLVDNFTSQVINIHTTPVYNFSVTSNSASQGMNRFYIVVANNTTVPVDLLRFDARLNSHKEVELKWATTSEINTSHFEVERSVNGIEYALLETVNAYGSIDLISNYAYTDRNPEPVNYYRLKMVDKDGSYKYSEIRVVNMNDKGSAQAQFYPVPFNTELTVSQELIPIVQIKVISIWGQTLHTQSVNHQNTVKLDMTGFASGIYIVEVTDESGKITREQLVKQ
jgi:hypothetical protein